MTERRRANIPRPVSNWHTIDPKCKVHSRHYEMLSTGTFPKSLDKNEGLTFLPGDQWRDLGDLPWHYRSESPFEYGSQFARVESFPLSEKSSQIELEWQWIMNQQQSPKTESFPLSKPRECFNEDSLEDRESDAQVQTEASTTTSSLLTSLNSEGTSDADTSKSSRNSRNLSMELERETTKPSSLKDVENLSNRADIEWQRAGTKELAELLSRKGHCYLENCDLPPSQSSYSWKSPLVNSDFSPPTAVNSYESADPDKIPVTGVSSGLVPRRVIDPLPTIVPSGISSPNSASTSSSTASPKRSKQALGEALCRSQTRARQGEKLAAQVLQEKAKLLELLFEEARTMCTYRHWVQMLELENKLLKACSGSEEKNAERKKSSGGFEHLEDRNAWRRSRKRAAPSRRRFHEGKGENNGNAARGWSPENSALVRCTIGLAFALGLSFAGAGLMIGWSMGWILLK